MGEDECWDPIRGWFSCNKVGCYAFRDEASCAALKNRQLYDDRGIGRNVTEAAQDWARSQRDENGELLQDIADSTQQLIGNVGRNVTDSLENAVNRSFDQIQNQTMRFLNETRSEIIEGIEDAREELMRELDGDSDDEHNYDGKYAYYKDVNLLADAQNEKTSATKIALCASAGAATASSAPRP